MLDKLKQDVYEANMDLPKYDLISFASGNISAIDRANGLIVIKPSGIHFENLTPDMMLITDLFGNIVEGGHKVPSDIYTHIELYRAFSKIGSVGHVHSIHATAWAQAGRDIPAYGTTHADYFMSAIPCTRTLNNQEIEHDYQKNIGLLIAETFDKRGISPSETPAAIVFHHGPYCWGKNCFEAVNNAFALESLAKMAYLTEQINPDTMQVSKNILDKQHLGKQIESAHQK